MNTVCDVRDEKNKRVEEEEEKGGDIIKVYTHEKKIHHVLPLSFICCPRTV